MIIIWDKEEYCWPHYNISVLKANILLLIIFFIPAPKITVQYGHIDTLNSKIRPLVIILQDMEKYYWPHNDIFVPKENIWLIILLYLPASKCTLWYGHKDTLNSKIHTLVIILSQNREEQKYLTPPPFPWERERERENCGGGGVILSLHRTLQQCTVGQGWKKVQKSTLTLNIFLVENIK